MCCYFLDTLCYIFTMFFFCFLELLRLRWGNDCPSHALGIIIAPVPARYPTRAWLYPVSNKHDTAKCERCVLFLGWNVFVRHTTEVIKTRPPSRLSGRHATITELPARDSIASTNPSSNLVSIKPCPQDFCIHHTSGHEAYNHNSKTSLIIKSYRSKSVYCVHAITALPLCVGNISDDRTFDIQPPMSTICV